MKWFTNRHAYLLALMAMLFCVALQIAWLIQLFHAQQVQVRRDLDQAVGNAARMSDYLSVAPGHERSENFRIFFLSTEWMLIKQSFARLRGRHLGGSFSSQITKDSTFLKIGINMANNKVSTKKQRTRHIFDEGETWESIRAADKRDLKRMDSLVGKECSKLHLYLNGYHILYDYESGKPESKTDWEKSKKADYRSQLYGYNLNFFLHTYQLVVPSLNPAVYYRMRYYLLSSLLMLILTAVAFIFLFRVIRTQKMYSQARISFAGNMTHELKTPVSVVEAAIDAITRYQLYQEPEKLNNYLAVSKSELRRLTLMIDKVLHLDELDNGGIKLRMELYDIQQGLESVVASMQLRNPKGTAIIYEPAEEPCFVKGDPVHLGNVFYNLTDNALKYSGKDAVVTITVKPKNEKIEISFQDNGPGIGNIYQKQIFERFFRITDNPDIHNVKGSGLGLHYVKQIVEQHGGGIHLRSFPGKGSNFVVELPAYYEL